MTLKTLKGFRNTSEAQNFSAQIEARVEGASGFANKVTAPATKFAAPKM